MALTLPERPTFGFTQEAWQRMTLRELIGLVGWVLNHPNNPDRQDEDAIDMLDMILICSAELVGVNDGDLSSTECFSVARRPGGVMADVSVRRGFADTNALRPKVAYLDAVILALPSESVSLVFVRTYKELLTVREPSLFEAALDTLKDAVEIFARRVGTLGEDLVDTSTSAVKWIVAALVVAFVAPPLARAFARARTELRSPQPQEA